MASVRSAQRVIQASDGFALVKLQCCPHAPDLDAVQEKPGTRFDNIETHHTVNRHSLQRQVVIEYHPN